MVSYHRPESIKEAVSLLTPDTGTATIIGGGTIEMPLISSKPFEYSKVIDLGKLGLDSFGSENGQVTIGAYCKISDVVKHEGLAFLKPVAETIGGPAIRNLATVGGNVMCGGDLTAALLALDAEVHLHAAGGASVIKLDHFYAQDDEQPVILSQVSFAEPDQGKFSYYKLARRRLNAKAIIAAAVCGTPDGNTIVGLCGASEAPLKLQVEADLFADDLSESALVDLITSAAADCEPPTDSHATSAYRKLMIPVAVKRAIAQAHRVNNKGRG